MSKAEIVETFRRIAAKEPGSVHGDFLTVFAEAVVRADFENFAIIQDAAEALIRKYSLGGKYPEHKPNHDRIGGPE